MKSSLLMMISIIIVHCMVPVLPIHGMDPAPILDNKMIVWKLILEHGVPWFDYHKIQSLVVSKVHDKLLRNTAQCRKTYLCKQLGLKSDNLIWHKYGAMCGRILFKSDGLYVKRFYLHQYGYRSQPITIYYGTFETAVPHESKPYFNNRGVFCFYTYSTSYSNEKSGTIFKNKWHSSSKSWTFDLQTENCIAAIGSQAVNLKIFLEFPVLLKAFLKSRMVYREKDNWWITGCDIIKMYDLKGVTIPKNYRKHRQYFSTITYASFDDLPKVVRQAVVARYKEQRKKR